MRATSDLRSAAEFCELGDRAVIRPFKRLEETGGLFLAKRNRRQTDEDLALLVTAPGFGPMRFRALRRLHRSKIVRGKSAGLRYVV